MPNFHSRTESLYSILTAAINDFATNGFQSQEQLRIWVERIQRAIEFETPSEQAMVQALRDALQIIFDRSVTNGGLLKQHKGIPRYTFEMLRPKLQDELTRRIVAATDLIKLNREEAVKKTLQRFSGWMSSVPPGGAAEINRVKVKAEIRRPLAQLDFVARRLHIDQSAKMLSNLSAIVAEDSGAIAAQWHSRWRVPGYAFRPDHKDRDEKWYLIKNSWAHQKGFVKPGPAGYSNDMTQPAYEIFCQCRFSYGYSLRDLPEYMITQRGKDELDRVKAEIARQMGAAAA